MSTVSTPNPTTVLIDEEEEGNDDTIGFGFSNRNTSGLRSSRTGTTGSIHNNNNNNNTPSSSSPPININNGIVPLPCQSSNPSIAYTFQSIDNPRIQHYLSSLQDEHSLYMNVAKACHFFNQFGTHGSYNTTPMPSSSSSSSSSMHMNMNMNMNMNMKPPTVIQSTMLNIQQYTSDISHILNTLSNTASSHSDRRCRILSLQSMSIIANATLSKLISTPKLYSNRESMIHINRIQDVICNDVIISIINCSLEDDDDGVSSIAIECLGRFVINDITCHNDLTNEIYMLKSSMMTKVNHLIPNRGIWDGEGGRGGCGGYADIVQDVDYSIQKSDIIWRIMNSVVSQRIRKLFVRVTLFKRIEHKVRCLDTLNTVMIFVYKTESVRRGIDIGKDMFAMRWYEFDATMLIQEYVQVLVIPLLRNFDSTIGGAVVRNGIEMSIGVVRNALLLCSSVKCKEMWLDQLIQLSLHCLERALELCTSSSSSSSSSSSRSTQTQYSQEMKSNLIAMTLIALRGIQQEDRVRILLIVVDMIGSMPSTIPISKGTISFALQFEDGSRRSPSRVGFWAEIALAVLLPDGFSNNNNKVNNYKYTTNKNYTTRRNISQHDIASPSTTTLKHLLHSSPVKSLFKSRSSSNNENKSVINPAEEMVYTLCSVAYTIGKRIYPQIVAYENMISVDNVNNNDNDDVSHVSIDVNNELSIQAYRGEGSSWIQSEFESWFYASLELLNSFLPCLTWEPALSIVESESNIRKNNNVDLERMTTFCCACQRAYMELLKVVLFASGMLTTTNSSVFLHFISSIPTASDENSPGDVRVSLQSNIRTENELRLLLDKLLKLLTETETGRLSRGQKISLLALLSDSWVQQCKVMMSSNKGLQLDQKEIAGPVDVDEDVANINEEQARQLLSQLAMEISTLLTEEKNRDNNPDTTLKAGKAQRYLMTCIASVETIGYTAQLVVNHFSKSKTNTENEESAKYIVTDCIVVLRGQGKLELDMDYEDNLTSIDAQSKGTVHEVGSPPRSQYSQARITSFTSECSDAAKRLQNFVSYYDNEFDFSNKNQQTIDFSCLCPLFKRPNFGVTQDNKCFINDLWIIDDQLLLVTVANDSDSPLFGEEPTQNSKEALFQLQQHIGGEKYHLGYFLQIYRQLLSKHIEQAIATTPLHFLKHPLPHVESSAFENNPTYRNIDPLRLCTPPLPTERFPLGHTFNKGKADWSNCMVTTSSASDPLSITLSYSIRQCPRFDGDVEWGLIVTVTVYNITAVPILNGVKMDASISKTENDGLGLNQATSITSVYKNELEAGGHFIWEFVLDSWPLGGEISVSCTLRELEAESSTYQMLDFPKDEGNEEQLDDNEQEVPNNKLDGGDDDLNDDGDHGDDEGEETIDIVFTGTPISIPSMIILQPNPLVFYRDCIGDQIAFQFLWFSMPHCLPKIDMTVTTTITNSEENENDDIEEKKSSHDYNLNNACQVLTSSSILTISCQDNDQENETISAWAFSTWCGKHILAMATSNVDNNNCNSQVVSLSVRGDDLNMLQFCVESQKQHFVSELTNGKWCVV